MDFYQFPNLMANLREVNHPISDTPDQDESKPVFFKGLEDEHPFTNPFFGVTRVPELWPMWKVNSPVSHQRVARCWQADHGR